jgi:hypothetical protein
MSFPYLDWIKQTTTMNINNTNNVNASNAVDSSGNTYVSYSSFGTPSGGTHTGAYDVVVFKMDTNGNVVWIKQESTMNTTGYDFYPSIAADSSGNVYVSYQSDGTVSGGTFLGGYDVVVFKLDINGNTVWSKQTEVMNTVGNDQYPKITVDSSENVYVSYFTNNTVSGGTNVGDMDVVVFKLDINGNMVWIKQTEVMNTTSIDQYPTIAADSSGNVYVSYYTGGTVSGGTLTGAYDIVVFKMDTNGNMVWIKQEFVMNTTSYDQYPSIAVDSSGNVYVSYHGRGTVSGGINIGNSDVAVFKMDTNGNVVWIKEHSSTNTIEEDTDTVIAVDSSGNVYVTYNTVGKISGGENIGSNKKDIVVFKLDNNGDVVWTMEEPIMNSTKEDSYPGIGVDSLGNVYVSYNSLGTVSGGETTQGYYNVVVFKLKQSLIPLAPPLLNVSKSLYDSRLVQISWITKNGANSINIYRDTQASGLTSSLIGSSSVYSYIDSSITIAGQYYYFASGVYNGVETALSSAYGFNYDVSMPILAWIKETNIMNTPGQESYPIIVTDLSGNVYTSYQTTGTISGGAKTGSTDIAVFKMDKNGNIVWIKETNVMNSAGNNINQKIAVDSSGNVYVSYQSDGTVSGGTNIGSNDIVVFKLDTNGNMVWIKQQDIMNTSGNDLYPGIGVDTSGNIYISYQTDGTQSGGTNIGSNDIVVFKMDNNGNMVWIKQTDVMNTTGDDVNAQIQVDSIGNVYVCYESTGTVSGGSRLYVNQPNVVIFKLNTNGNMVWVKQTLEMNSAGYSKNPTIAVDSSGNVYLSHYTYGTVSGGMNTGANDIVVFKMDTNGNMVWIKQNAYMNTSTEDIYPSTAVDLSGNVYVSYNTNGTVSGGTFLGQFEYDNIMFKLDTNGNNVWTRQEGIMNNPEFDSSPSIALNSDGDVFVSYYTQGGTVSGGTSHGSYNNEIVIFKYIQSPPNTEPNAATGVIAVHKSLCALVSWVKPSSNGGSVITSYTISAITGGSTVSTGTVYGENNLSGYVYGLSNGTAYTFTVYAVNAIGTSPASTASSAVTPVADVPTTSVTVAVATGDTITITSYVASTSTTTPEEKAAVTIDMRVSLKAGGTTATTEQLVANELAFIDSMRAKVGADSYTIPITSFADFVPTLSRTTTETLLPKPITTYVPIYNTGTLSTSIDVSALLETNYAHIEIPIGYTVVLQNRALSISLLFNGTNFSDGTTTYNTGSTIILGTKSFTIIGSGSITVSVQDTNAVICITKGSMVLTPSGNVAAETLKCGNKVITGDNRVVYITKIAQIVIAHANVVNAPYVIEKDAFGNNNPPNQLMLSPLHAIQIKPNLWEIPFSAAMVNKKVYQAKDKIGNAVEYYHFALENYATDTLVVNGQPVEALNNSNDAQSYLWNQEKGGYIRMFASKALAKAKAIRGRALPTPAYNS